MTPRRRANAIQAHSLHCQGLTYRQIGERMNRSISTVATYIKDFHTHRDEITASLAAEQLVHSLSAINTPDPELHQQHINTARELRLQVDTLDKVTERRQRRDRRIQEEQIKDFTRESKAAEELAKTLIENDLWEDPTPLNHFAATGQLLPKSSPSGGAVAKRLRGPAPVPPSDAPRPDAGPRATNPRNSTTSLSPQTSPKKPKENPSKPKSNSQKSKQTRTNPNKTEQAQPNSPAKQAQSTSKRRKTKKQRRQKPPKPQLPPKPTGPEYPASWDNPLGYVPRRNEEIPLVRELFGRPHRR